MNEPIADAARSILDGHVVLSRALATAGHFPTVDVLDSVSRVAPAITTPDQASLSRELRRIMAAYRDARDLVEIGAYRSGANPLVDRAIELRDPIEAFLCQELNEPSPVGDAWARLAVLLAETPSLAPPDEVLG